MIVITLARKPLPSSTTACVLNNGCGALNIDSCRVGTENMSTQWDREWKPQKGVMGRRYDQQGREKGKQVPDGRWPANLLLTADAALRMNEQSGIIPTESWKRQKDGAHPFGNATGSEYSIWKTVQEPEGGSSRYFKVFN